MFKSEYYKIKRRGGEFYAEKVLCKRVQKTLRHMGDNACLCGCGAVFGIHNSPIFFDNRFGTLSYMLWDMFFAEKQVKILKNNNLRQERGENFENCCFKSAQVS